MLEWITLHPFLTLLVVLLIFRFWSIVMVVGTTILLAVSLIGVAIAFLYEISRKLLQGKK